MRLYIEGHSVKKGYAISPELSDAECSKQPPSRQYSNWSSKTAWFNLRNE